MKPRLLLDTHCFLWLQSEPDRLASGVLRMLDNPQVELFLSAASAWEIAIKYALDKLPLPEPPDRYVPSRMEYSGMVPLPIRLEHALSVASLPLHHRDPFDRILVAQAQVSDATLVTVDRDLARYDVPLLWANVEPDTTVHEPLPVYGSGP